MIDLSITTVRLLFVYLFYFSVTKQCVKLIEELVNLNFVVWFMVYVCVPIRRNVGSWIARVFGRSKFAKAWLHCFCLSNLICRYQKLRPCHNRELHDFHVPFSDFEPQRLWQVGSKMYKFVYWPTNPLVRITKSQCYEVPYNTYFQIISFFFSFIVI